MTDTRELREPVTTSRFRDVQRLLQKHRTADVLTFVAQVAAELSEPSEDSLERWRMIAPWTLAGLAREAIVHCRSSNAAGLTDEQFRALLNTYSMSYDSPPTAPPDAQRFALLANKAYEQLIFQESDSQETTRTLGLFDDEVTANAGRLECIHHNVVEQLVGGPLHEALEASQLLWAWAQQGRGVLPVRVWEDKRWRDFCADVTPAVVRAVGRINDFGRSNSSEVLPREHVPDGPVPAHLRRYLYNPLMTHPLVRVGDRVIAPQLRFIRRRFSPAGIFYAGIKKYGNAFSKDFGVLAESYGGRLLRQLAGATVTGEVSYREDGSDALSIDWFVVMPQVTLLVEMKACRPDSGLRLGASTLSRPLNEQLSKAVKQLNRSAANAASRHPAFAHVLTDRPMLGLVVTAEPFYLANDSSFRDLLPNPDIPTMFGSLRDLEAITGYTLHIIVQSRIRYDGPTRDYVARRTTEGKTGREIKHCLSRYIARDLYRLLESGPITA